VQSITSALHQAETMAGVQVSSVVTSMTGSHIRSLNSHGIVAIKNKEVRPVDITKVIEAARAVVIPADREVLHVLPQEFIIDGQDGIKDPLGISGVRLECRVHIITASATNAQNIVKCANRAGLTVSDLVVSPYVAGRAILTPEEQELGVALIDIGGGTTDVMVMHRGALKHTLSLPVGGNHITNDIAAGLRTPLVAAENIKCKYGTAKFRAVGKNETIEVPSASGNGESRSLSKIALAEIIEPRVSEIFKLAQREIIRANCEDYLISGIVLTGGTSNLHGCIDVAEQVFNLPARIGEPTNVLGLSELVKGPEFSTLVGLIVHQLNFPEIKSEGKILASRAGGSIVKKVGNWFRDNF